MAKKEKEKGQTSSRQSQDWFHPKDISISTHTHTRTPILHAQNNLGRECDGVEGGGCLVGEFKLVEMAQVIKRSHGNEKEILRVREREREKQQNFQEMEICNFWGEDLKYGKDRDNRTVEGLVIAQMCVCVCVFKEVRLEFYCLFCL